MSTIISSPGPNTSEPIEVVTLREIQSALGIYSNGDVFRDWLKVAETPAPHIRINAQDYWLKSQVEDFSTLWQAHLKELSDKRVAELQKETVGKIELLTALADYAKRVERLNSRCYKNSRGSSSLNAGRQRVLELQGAIEFAHRALGGFREIPFALREETAKALENAKKYVGI